jgi:hypothetical protein
MSVPLLCEAARQRSGAVAVVRALGQCRRTVSRGHDLQLQPPLTYPLHTVSFAARAGAGCHDCTGHVYSTGQLSFHFR